jgi:hypothetical protein
VRPASVMGAIFPEIIGLENRAAQVDEGIWIVSFMHYDLGYVDLEQKTLQPWTTRSARGCYLCLRYRPLPMSPV